MSAEDLEAIRHMSREELVTARIQAVERFVNLTSHLWDVTPAEECTWPEALRLIGPVMDCGWLFVKLSVDVGDGEYIMQAVGAPGMTPEQAAYMIVRLYDNVERAPLPDDDA